MTRLLKLPLCFFLLFLISFFHAQNQTKKWCFGNHAGLDFSTSPPTSFSSAIVAPEGSASIADASGNLLFYTDGKTVWNRLHLTMPGGSLTLSGDPSSAQSALIIKKPGSPNLYYIFTQKASITMGVQYSIVDMSLAGGLGDVSVLNVPVSQSGTEHLTAAKHCNGTDYWIITHKRGNFSSPDFEAYAFGSTGVSTVPVVSAAGFIGYVGCMKVSPNAKKLATSALGTMLFDFDNSTGIISNSITLDPASNYGCEFSPDGNFLYSSTVFSGSGYKMTQWDLCAGSSTAIVASAYTFPLLYAQASMQLAPDGKIYITNTSGLGVINNPNNAGAACNYFFGTPALSTGTTSWGLPNFPGTTFFVQAPIAPFTYSINSLAACQTAFFTAPALSFTSMASCFTSTYSITGYEWLFGDPASGSVNTSTLANPAHLYTGLGTYTVQLVMHYTCGGANDTLQQIVNINQSCLTVNSTSVTCASLGSATVSASGTGPFSYTWMPGMQTGSAATALIPGTYTIAVFNGGNNYTYSTTITLYPLVPLTGNVAYTPVVPCYGENTGTASVTNLAGGSGTQTYLWSNGATTYTNVAPSTLGAGIWSVTVTDMLAGCQVNQQFLILQPPASTMNLGANTPTACAGTSIILTGTSSGGTPGYTYSWTTGPSAATHTVSEAAGGTYVYTLNSTDANNCLTSNTISVGFVNNPTLTVSNVSICPLQTGTLTVSGASSYTWDAGATGSTFTDNPLSDTEYTVTGTALSCTASATASIILKPVPVPTLSSNSPVCNGQTLQLSGSGGAAYVWTGPQSFTSNLQNPVINPAAPNQSGTYNLTVTAANGCTASTNQSLTVNPTPTLTASGSTVCSSQTLQLNASSVAGASYLWTGPVSFTSANQNVSIASPSVSQSGTYTVIATSAEGCTNSATAQALVVLPPALLVSLSGNGTLCAQALNGSPNTITLTSSGANTYTLSTPLHINNSNPSGPATNLSNQPPYNPGVATATIQGSNGICTASTTINFSIIPNPTITVSSPTPVICAGNSYTYTNSGANSYTWGPGSPGLTTYTSPVTVASPTVTTVYSVFGGSLGCNSGTQTSTITVNPLPTVTITPGTPTICLGSTVHLTANGTGTSYEWWPLTGLTPATGATVSAGPLTQQNYTVIASLNSCTASALVTVSIVPLPTPSITVSSPRVCQDESITMQGFGGHSYGWLGPCPALYDEQTVTFTASSFNYSGTYTLIAVDEKGCKNAATTSIIIDPLPDGILGGDKMQACVPFCSDFKFYPAPTTGTAVTTSWEFNNRTINSSTFNACFTTAGNYKVIGRFTDNIHQCRNTNTFVIVAYAKPAADFESSPLKPVENTEQVLFTNTSTGENINDWTWYIKDQQSEYRNSSEHNSHFFADAGTYPVVLIVKNNRGCEDTIIKTIHIEADFALYVPNAFTPNEDRKNEIFRPVTRGIKLYTFMVYDRWGEQLFFTNDPANGWDGSFRGQPCKQDVYFWKLEVSGNGGEIKKMRGSVTLLK